MPNTLPIFIGSTFTDLAAHRAAVLYALQRLEALARGMEHFGSLPGMPRGECLRILRSCRVYIGVFAMRYGSIDEATGKSITELEYDEARQFRLRPLIYLIDEEHQPVLPKNVDFGEAAEKLQSFKSRLRHEHVVSFFTTPDDLAMRVSQDIARIMQEGELEVQASALADIVKNLPRADLKDDSEFAFLREKIGGLAAPIGSDVVLREVLQFLLSGDKLSAMYLVAKTSSLTVRDAIRLLMEIERVILGVVVKGYRILEEQGRISPEFVRAFEKHISPT